MPTTDLLAAALAHAERGWHVFPLRPNDKRPAFPDHPADSCAGATRAAAMPAGTSGGKPAPPPTPTASAAHGRPGPTASASPAARPACGGRPGRAQGRHHRADRVGPPADLARQHGTDIDATYTVTTGRGGTHLYYRHPTTGPALRNTAGSLGPMVDTRAHGGYIVAAGSTVAGRPYLVDLDTDPAPLPGA